ncbi:hypothetical protein BDZ89DRAFT_1138371 [Hymenopellis radicata]|nr:hypothetical protein BDZ89DRAFT_1138371 [Hymenopellis radicata]
MPKKQSAGCLTANSGHVVPSPIIDYNTSFASISQTSANPLPIMMTLKRTRATHTNNGSCLALSSDLSTSADSDSTAREEPWPWQMPIETGLSRSPASAGCSVVSLTEDVSREDVMGGGSRGLEVETMLLDQSDLEKDQELHMEELTLHQSIVRETFAPIRRLPAEVLLMIFDVLCSVFHKDDFPEALEWDGPLRHTAPLRLSMVCATWKSLISHTKRLWRVIALDVGWSCDQEELQRLVQIYMDRSGTAGLHIYVFSFTDDDMDELDMEGGTWHPMESSSLMRLLIGEAHRWQSLSLIVGNRRTVHDLFQSLPESLPQLASFTVGDVSEPSEDNSIRCTVPSMPALKHLSFPLSFPSTLCTPFLPLTQIESLDVGLAAAQLPPFMDVVQEEIMPCLTRLRVGGYHTPAAGHRCLHVRHAPSTRSSWNGILIGICLLIISLLCSHRSLSRT